MGFGWKKAVPQIEWGTALNKKRKKFVKLQIFASGNLWTRGATARRRQEIYRSMELTSGEPQFGQ